MLQAKSHALSCFIHFKTMIENQLDLKTESLQTDGDKEYVAFSKYLVDNDI